MERMKNTAPKRNINGSLIITKFLRPLNSKEPFSAITQRNRLSPAKPEISRFSYTAGRSWFPAFLIFSRTGMPRNVFPFSCHQSRTLKGMSVSITLKRIFIYCQLSQILADPEKLIIFSVPVRPARRSCFYLSGSCRHGKIRNKRIFRFP